MLLIFQILLQLLSLFYCLLLCLCVGKRVPACGCLCQKRVLDPLTLGLQVARVKKNFGLQEERQALNHWAPLQPLESSFEPCVQTSRTLPGCTMRCRMVCRKRVFSSARTAVLSLFPVASVVIGKLHASRAYSDIMSLVL